MYYSYCGITTIVAIYSYSSLYLLYYFCFSFILFASFSVFFNLSFLLLKTIWVYKTITTTTTTTITTTTTTRRIPTSFCCCLVVLSSLTYICKDFFSALSNWRFFQDVFKGGTDIILKLLQDIHHIN